MLVEGLETRLTSEKIKGGGEMEEEREGMVVVNDKSNIK
jgi:hypothetical protein